MSTIVAALLAACSAPAAQPTAVSTVAPTASPAASPTLPASASPSASPTELRNLNTTPMPDTPVTPEYRGLDPLGDARNMTAGPVFLDFAEVVVQDSAQGQEQVRLRLVGSKPTPCHHLRAIVSGPDARNRIDVEVYTVSDPEVMCIQVLAEFDEWVDLGSLASGKYTVWVNDEQVGDFTR